CRGGVGRRCSGRCWLRRRSRRGRREVRRSPHGSRQASVVSWLISSLVMDGSTRQEVGGVARRFLLRSRVAGLGKVGRARRSRPASDRAGSGDQRTSSLAAFATSRSFAVSTSRVREIVTRGKVEFELCAGGGQDVIRRTDRTGKRVVVSEVGR